MHVVLMTPDLGGNSLGRTFCLWQLAHSLGWRVDVVAVRGAEVWKPLQGSLFAASCRVSSEAELLSEFGSARPDLILAVKPLPDSFGIALRLSDALDLPLLLDIDDPDLESQLTWRNPIKRAAKSVLRRQRMTELKYLREVATTVPVLVSNPNLQARHGGTIIPHVRVDTGFGNPHVSSSPTVAFIGTNRKHKGVAELRRAVGRLQDIGVELVVTDQAPADAKPWEKWIGSTTMERGREIVAESDIVVIPSRRGLMASLQLPAKLMDAMISGRGIAVSNVGPLPWAVGESGVVFQPSSTASLTAAILTLADPALRSEFGKAARERALEFATVDANAEPFELAVRSAIERGPRKKR